MKRRDFMVRLAGALAGRGLVWSNEVQAAAQQHATHRRTAKPVSAGKITRVAISSWSFHNYFQATREKELSEPGSMLTLLDFPEMIADRYKVHNLEFVAPHFASTEPTYLRELKAKLVRAYSYLVNIPLDIEEVSNAGGLSDPDEEIRARAISAVEKWIDIGKALGAHSVRADPGKLDPADLTTTIDSYRKLAAYGKSKGLYVIIENHDGVGSEHPEELIKVFKGVGNSFAGALPDFGNFPDEATRQHGLQLLFPYARTICHAKGLEFDAGGNETRFEFNKCVEISKQSGYKGVYSIEYEGPDDTYAGVQKVMDELVRYL
jgi:sugar phosphate isomerase/epimerase